MKQLIYFTLFVFVFGGITFGIYSWVSVEPTCFDGVQNQEEGGVDCGGSCEKICLDTLTPLDVIDAELIQIEENDYDFVAEIRNPNMTHGSGKVLYEITLKDSSGDVVKTVDGEFHILPGQTRYVFVSPIQSDSAAVSAELIVTEPNWQQLTDFGVGDIRLIDRRKEFTEVNDGTVTGKVEGVIYNNSEFDFDKVEILVVLFDLSGDLIGAGTTNVRTFLSNKENFYEVSWFRSFENSVSRIEVQASTNAFENDNFLRRYGGDEQFQQI
jgi:hypothetical protein